MSDEAVTGADNDSDTHDDAIVKGHPRPEDSKADMHGDDSDEKDDVSETCESVAAAASVTKQLTESQIADLQRKLESLHVDKSAFDSTKKVLEEELANARKQLKMEVYQRKQAEVESTLWRAKYHLILDELELLRSEVCQRLDQVEAEKAELQRQLDSVCGECREHVPCDQSLFPKTFREAFDKIRSHLQNRLDTRHGLLDELLQRGVLHREHCDDICQFQNDELKRADRLMDNLQRRPDSYLTQFYYALEANDQRDLVQFIKYKDQRPVGVHKVARLEVCGEDETFIEGLTTLGVRIYIVCHESPAILVFTSQQPFRRLQDIVVHRLEAPSDIAASTGTGCLYVPDPSSGAIWRISINKGTVVQSLWLLGLYATTISVTDDDRFVLLVNVDMEGSWDECSHCWHSEVRVYSAEAVLETVVKLPAGLTSPLSVFMTKRKTFIVSHGTEWQKTNRVCEVDMTGRVLKAFGSTPGHSAGQLCRPCDVSEDSQERSIVADCYNNRLLLLNEQLTSPRVLVAWRPQFGSDVKCPLRLHYDRQSGYLLVTLCSGDIDIYDLRRQQHCTYCASISAP